MTVAKSGFRRELAKEFHNQPSVDRAAISEWVDEGGNVVAPAEAAASDKRLGHIKNKVAVVSEHGRYALTHGSIVIAAITSCTNTSNPSVMLAAGLLAKKAVARGLTVKPWVKTSLAPGSKVVTQYLKRAGLSEPLEKLHFNLVGYGCTTCIGNSGPIAEAIAGAVKQGNLVACAILSGNRNFEGRINPVVRFNYLASPPLVVAYAIAGTIDIDLQREPLGTGPSGKPVYLHDVWPSQARSCVRGQRLGSRLDVLERVRPGIRRRRAMAQPQGSRGQLFRWAQESLYVKAPPFFDGVGRRPASSPTSAGARVLAMVGDSVTTDHISPAGSIAADISGGQVSDRARRAAEGVQLVRRAAR